jgi:hypothetical protein
MKKEKGHKLKDERVATPNQSQHVSSAKTLKIRRKKKQVL